VLLASHVLPEIEKIATRVMILLDGRLLTGDALKESAGGIRIRVRAAGPEAAVRNICVGIAGVRSIAAEHDGGGAPVRYVIEAERRPSLSLAADIVTALVAGGIAITEVTDVPHDLERVFLDLTRRPAQAAA
jgi:ABC-2 type transport system ATP-binding protein